MTAIAIEMGIDNNDDEDGFGEFTFAPLSNHNRNQTPNRTLHSNSSMMNGLDFIITTTTTTTTNAGDEDDDWGDFVVGSGGLAHTLSLPKISVLSDSVDPGPGQPGSAPGRVGSVWEKPSGALPLSLFGELEDAEELGSGEAGPSLDDKGASFFVSKKSGGDFVKKEKGKGSVNVSDLLADLYKRNEAQNGSRPDPGVSGLYPQSISVERVSKNEAMEQNLKSTELNSGWDWSVVNEAKSSSQGLDFDWKGADLNQNRLDAAKQVNLSANGCNFDNNNNGLRPDPGVSGLYPHSDSVERVSKNEAMEQNLKSSELNSGWDWSVANEAKSSSQGLDFDWKDADLNRNRLDSAKEVNLSANGGDFDNNDDDDVDDDGWEFKAAESSKDEKEDSSKLKTNQIKTENGMASNVNGVSSSWNSLSLDFNGWSWNVNSSTNWSSTGVDENRKLGPNDKDSKTQGGDENSKVFDSSWDLSYAGSNKLGSNSTGLSHGGKQLNSVTVDENQDFNYGNGWGFKGAEPELKVRDGVSEGDHKKTQNVPVLNINGSNASWDMFSFSAEGMNSKVNGVNSDIKQVDFCSVNEADDLGDEDGWEFKVAESEPNLTAVNTKLEFSEESKYGSVSNNAAQGPADLFEFSQQNSEKSAGFGFDSNASSLTENGAVDHKHEQNDGQPSTADDKVKESWNAFSEIGSTDKEAQKVAATAVEPFAFDSEIEGSKTTLNNHKGALPLSIFGYEEEETVNPVISEDIASQMPTTNQNDGIKSPLSNTSINDIISSLYSQAEPSCSPYHAQYSSENGFSYNETVTPSDLANGSDDFDDDSWEFKDASPGTEDHASVDLHEKSHTNYKLQLNDFVDFFSKLKLELLLVAESHLDNLKKDQSAATNEEAAVQALDKEIQDLHHELDKDGSLSAAVHSENHSPGKICLSQFVEVLQEPKFQALESEYQLSKKLLLAESDLRSTIELLKHVALAVKIITLASKEEQSSYVSAWSKMLSACSEELEHGVSIWKQAIEKNVHDQILSKPQGKKHIVALAEIYRIVEILRSSARLYKPWVLASSTDPMGLFSLLSQCSILWSNSGLEEALQSISDPADFKSDESTMTLLESIKYIHNLDEPMLYNHVFSGQGPMCQLSALVAGTVPGMKIVSWNEEQYFLSLANFWANLVSVNPPSLPRMHVGG